MHHLFNLSYLQRLILKIKNESGMKFEVKTAWNSAKQNETKEWGMSMDPEMATLIEQV